MQQRGSKPSQAEGGIALCRRRQRPLDGERAPPPSVPGVPGVPASPIHHHTSTRPQTPARRHRQRRNSRLPSRRATGSYCCIASDITPPAALARKPSLARPAAQRAPQIPFAVRVCITASENRPLAFRPTSAQVIVCGCHPGRTLRRRRLTPTRLPAASPLLARRPHQCTTRLARCRACNSPGLDPAAPAPTQHCSLAPRPRASARHTHHQRSLAGTPTPPLLALTRNRGRSGPILGI